MNSLNRSGKMQLWIKSSIPPNFINKDSWDHLQVYAVCIAYISFHATKTKLKQDVTDCIAPKAKYLLFGSLQQKFAYGWFKGWCKSAVIYHYCIITQFFFTVLPRVMHFQKCIEDWRYHLHRLFKKNFIENSFLSFTKNAKRKKFGSERHNYF